MCHTFTNLAYVRTILVIILHINICVHEYYTVGIRVWASKDWSKVCTIFIMVDQGLCINIPHHLLTGCLFSTNQHSASFTYGLSIFHTSPFSNMYLPVAYFPHINILHHLLTGCLFSTHQHSAPFTFRLSIFHTSTFINMYLLVVYFPHINIPHHLPSGCLFSTHQHSPPFNFRLSIFHTSTFPTI